MPIIKNKVTYDNKHQYYKVQRILDPQSNLKLELSKEFTCTPIKPCIEIVIKYKGVKSETICKGITELYMTGNLEHGNYNLKEKKIIKEVYQKTPEEKNAIYELLKGE